MVACWLTHQLLLLATGLLLLFVHLVLLQPPPRD